MSVHFFCWRCGAKQMMKRRECGAEKDSTRSHWDYVQDLERRLQKVRERVDPDNPNLFKRLSTNPKRARRQHGQGAVDAVEIIREVLGTENDDE